MTKPVSGIIYYLQQCTIYLYSSSPFICSTKYGNTLYYWYVSVRIIQTVSTFDIDHGYTSAIVEGTGEVVQLQQFGQGVEPRQSETAYCTCRLRTATSDMETYFKESKFVK